VSTVSAQYQAHDCPPRSLGQHGPSPDDSGQVRVFYCTAFCTALMVDVAVSLGFATLFLSPWGYWSIADNAGEAADNPGLSGVFVWSLLMITTNELAAAVGAEAASELSSALNKIKHCLSQLSAEQVWWRARPSLNSIGNVLLHLCGNLRQWIVAGLGGAVDVRNRPAEFAERGPIPKDELLRKLETVVGEAKKVLEVLPAEQLLKVRRIQGFDVSGLAAIFDSVPHFRGHTQEIVYMTRLQLGDAYKFSWTPSTPAQGAIP
jgi:hypothetical protein